MGEDVHPPAQFSDEGLRVRKADAAMRRVPNVRDDEPAVGSAGFESVLKPWAAPGRLWLAHDADIAAVVARGAPPVGERTARRPAVSETAEGNETRVSDRLDIANSSHITRNLPRRRSML